MRAPASCERLWRGDVGGEGGGWCMVRRRVGGGRGGYLVLWRKPAVGYVLQCGGGGAWPVTRRWQGGFGVVGVTGVGARAWGGRPAPASAVPPAFFLDAAVCWLGTLDE